MMATQNSSLAGGGNGAKTNSISPPTAPTKTTTTTPINSGQPQQPMSPVLSSSSSAAVAAAAAASVVQATSDNRLSASRNLVRGNSVATLNQIYQYHNSIPARNRILSTAKSLQPPSIDSGDVVTQPIGNNNNTLAPNSRVPSVQLGDESAPTLTEDQQTCNSGNIPVHLAGGSGYSQPLEPIDYQLNGATYASRDSLQKLSPSSRNRIHGDPATQLAIQQSIKNQKSVHPASTAIKIINVARRHKRSQVAASYDYNNYVASKYNHPGQMMGQNNWRKPSGESFYAKASANRPPINLSTDSSTSSGGSSAGVSPLHCSPVQQHRSPGKSPPAHTASSHIIDVTQSQHGSRSPSPIPSSRSGANKNAPGAGCSPKQQLSVNPAGCHSASGSPRRRILPSQPRAASINVADPTLVSSPIHRSIEGAHTMATSESGNLDESAATGVLSRGPGSSFKRRKLPQIPTSVGPLPRQHLAQSQWSAALNSALGSSTSSSSPSVSHPPRQQQLKTSPRYQMSRVGCHSISVQQLRVQSFPMPSNNQIGVPGSEPNKQQQVAIRGKQGPQLTPPLRAPPNVTKPVTRESYQSVRVRPKLSASSSSSTTSSSAATTSRSPTYLITPPNQPPSVFATKGSPSGALSTRYFTFDHAGEQQFGAGPPKAPITGAAMNNSTTTTNFGASHSPGASRPLDSQHQQQDNDVPVLVPETNLTATVSNDQIEGHNGAQDNDANGGAHHLQVHSQAGRGRRLSSCGSGLRANFLMNKQHAINECAPPGSLETGSCSRGSTEWSAANQLWSKGNPQQAHQASVELSAGGQSINNHLACGVKHDISPTAMFAAAMSGYNFANQNATLEPSAAAALGGSGANTAPSQPARLQQAQQQQQQQPQRPPTPTPISSQEGKQQPWPCHVLSANMVADQQCANSKLQAALSRTHLNRRPSGALGLPPRAASATEAGDSLSPNFSSLGAKFNAHSMIAVQYQPSASSQFGQTGTATGSGGQLAGQYRAVVTTPSAHFGDRLSPTPGISSARSIDVYHCNGADEQISNYQIMPTLSTMTVNQKNGADSSGGGSAATNSLLIPTRDRQSSNVSTLSMPVGYQFATPLGSSTSGQTYQQQQATSSATGVDSPSSAFRLLSATRPQCQLTNASSAGMQQHHQDRQKSLQCSAGPTTMSSSGDMSAAPTLGPIGPSSRPTTARTNGVGRKFGAWADCIAHTSSAFGLKSGGPQPGRRARSASQLEADDSLDKVSTRPSTTIHFRRHRRQTGSSSSSNESFLDGDRQSIKGVNRVALAKGIGIHSTSEDDTDSLSESSSLERRQPSSSLVSASQAAGLTESSPPNGARNSSSGSGGHPRGRRRRHRSRRARRRSVKEARQERTGKAGIGGNCVVDDDSSTSNNKEHPGKHPSDQLTIGDRLKLAERSANKLFRKVELSPKRVPSVKRDSSDSTASGGGGGRPAQTAANRPRKLIGGSAGAGQNEGSNIDGSDRNRLTLAVAQPTGGGESHEFADDEQGDDLLLFLRSFDIQQQQERRKQVDASNKLQYKNTNPVGLASDKSKDCHQQQQWRNNDASRHNDGDADDKSRRPSGELRAKSALGATSTVHSAAKVLRRAITFRSLVKSLGRRASSLGGQQQSPIRGGAPPLAPDVEPDRTKSATDTSGHGGHAFKNLLSVASADLARRSADNIQLRSPSDGDVPLTPTGGNSVRRRAARLFRRSKHSAASSTSGGSQSQQKSTSADHSISISFGYTEACENQPATVATKRCDRAGSQPMEQLESMAKRGTTARDGSTKQLTRMKSGEYEKPIHCNDSPKCIGAVVGSQTASGSPV